MDATEREPRLGALRRPWADYTQTEYWELRSGLKYYDRAIRLGRRFAPRAGSVLDVGSSHCEYINRLDWIPHRERIDLYPLKELEGVISRVGDFRSFKPSRPFDLVLCLQVLEHLEDPGDFCRRLFAAGKVVILSVPYNWPATPRGDHLHDPVDEDKLLSWTGRPWLRKYLVRDGRGRRRCRLVAAFRGDACSPWGRLELWWKSAR